MLSERYKSKLQAGGKIAIPAEICRQEEIMLHKGCHLKQSVENNSIVLYKPSHESTRASDSGASTLDGGYVLLLEQQHLESLGMRAGEPLYFSVVGDLIVIEKARCEKCGAEEQIVEYLPCHFRCKTCIASTIHWENEHRR